MAKRAPPVARARAGVAGRGRTTTTEVQQVVKTVVKAKRTPQPVVVPLQEAARNYAPRGIAALLAPITRPAFRKRAPAAASLFADWANLAGPTLAPRAQPVKFAGGTLTLGCSSPVAMELQMSQDLIIQRLNMGLGSGVVERLRFVQQAVSAAATPPARPVRRDVKPPTDLPQGDLGEALARLYQALKSRNQ